MKYASLGNRFLSTLIDGVIDTLVMVLVFGCAFIPLAIFTTALSDGNNSSNRSFDIGTLVMILDSCLLFIAVFAYTYARYIYLPAKNNGQTWGQKTMKVKMVTKEGHHIPSQGSLFVRYLVLQLLGIISLIGLLINEESKQTIHDIAAQTIVLEA